MSKIGGSTINTSALLQDEHEVVEVSYLSDRYAHWSLNGLLHSKDQLDEMYQLLLSSKDNRMMGRDAALMRTVFKRASWPNMIEQLTAEKTIHKKNVEQNIRDVEMRRALGMDDNRHKIEKWIMEGSVMLEDKWTAEWDKQTVYMGSASWCFVSLMANQALVHTVICEEHRVRRGRQSLALPNVVLDVVFDYFRMEADLPRWYGMTAHDIIAYYGTHEESVFS
jgi:hypothetical protein